MGTLELATTLQKANNIRYLDISANKVGSKAFAHIIKLISQSVLNLHTFCCRKNELEGAQLEKCFLQLRSTESPLRVLDLKDNCLNNTNAQEIVCVCEENILLEQVDLTGNKDVHS